MTSSIFCLLATELLEHIASQLDREDILAFRLSCRDVEEKTFHFFCCRFFKYLQTDLSHSSLARINALAKHKQFKQYAQCLEVSLGTGLGRDIVWERHSWGPLSSPSLVEDIQNLKNTLLYDLVNCRSFSILCQYPEGRLDLNRMTITDAVAIFLAVISNSCLPLKSFSLVYSTNQSGSLPMDMRRLPPLLHRQPGFLSAWSHLEELSIDQYLTQESFPFLCDLVISASNLRCLSLSLSFHELSAGFIHELASSDSLPSLQQLRLSRSFVEANDLKSLIRRLSGSLRVLDLQSISFISDDSCDSIFEELKSDLPVLQSISLGFLRANKPVCRVLTFPALRTEPFIASLPGKKCEVAYLDDKSLSFAIGVKYSGVDLSDVLEMLYMAGIYVT